MFVAKGFQLALTSVLALMVLIFSSAGVLAQDGLVARVGEVGISELDVALTAQRKMPMQVSFHGGISPEKIEEIRREAVAELIDQAYLINWAREQQLVVSPEELSEAMQPLLQRYPSEQAMRATLGEDVYQEVRTLIFRGLLAEKARAVAVEEKVVVSEAQVLAYYEANQERFFRPHQFRASHILIGVDPSASAEARAARRQTAEELLTQARAGENFYNLAYYNSDDRSRYVGGDLGYFHEGQVVSEFEDAVKAMTPGDISDLVRTRFGYHIIQLVENNPPRQMRLDEMSERIRAQLEKEQREALTEEWMAQLRTRYSLERFD